MRKVKPQSLAKICIDIIIKLHITEFRVLPLDLIEKIAIVAARNIYFTYDTSFKSDPIEFGECAYVRLLNKSHYLWARDVSDFRYEGLMETLLKHSVFPLEEYARLKKKIDKHAAYIARLNNYCATRNGASIHKILTDFSRDEN